MRIKVADAARILEVPEQSLRLWIAKGTCPFGSVMIEKKSRNGRNTYYINEERLNLYLQGKL